MNDGWIIGFVAAAVLAEIVCSVAFVIMRQTLDRIHYLTLATLTGPPLLLVAIAIQEGLTKNLLKAAFVVLLLVASGPLTSHVLGSAGYRLEVLRRRQAEEK